jgi:cell wall-associated NlpC family hydrolase
MEVFNMVQTTESKQLKEVVVNVAVSTVWTSPESPRELDRSAITSPLDIREWLDSMSTEERLKLCTDNLVQSQVLYGAILKVVEERDEWVKVIIPDQPSSKDNAGYPGWIPACQVSPSTHMAIEKARSTAAVTLPTTFLYSSEKKKGQEISFQTYLPVIDYNKNWITVSTPHGVQCLKREDAAILEKQENVKASGQDIIQSAKLFLGLPYLWGGMSGFGFDCSGFAYTMHYANGITVPRDASDQAKRGQAIKREELEAGDLIFFAYEEGKGRVHHVGIYVGHDQMIHAPKTGKSVEIIPLTGSTYEVEYAGARRFW